ncbi:MAG TPA: TonB-dependent receptor [Blastocatellia bacterium]|nr:TonB-dependent receptor [Blastocatellia bacterium]
MRIKCKRLLLAVLLMALVANLAAPVLAQNPTGAIRGTVTDPQGAIVANATVTVTNKATGESRKISTGSDGIYAVENLLPGDYEVKIEAQGFSTQVITAPVQVGNTTNGDAALRVGTKDEIVEIQAEAPQIDKTNYKIDGVIGRQKIDALPLNGRNFLQLALLEPGVGVTTKNPGSQNNLFNVSIGGAPSALTRLTVDGGSILDPVCGGAAQNFSTETIQEFQISTFNFDLSTGVTSVGAINIVSRTGSNDFHGSAFLFFRDHSLSALPTFFRPNRNFDPFFRRYQYGGALGGPIKKDRAFFFGNYERLDQSSAISTVVTGFPGSSAFNTVTNSPYKGNLANVRADFKINDKMNAFVRYSHDDNKVFAPDADNTLPSNWRVNSSDDDNIQGSLTRIFTQNLVNDARFNFQHIVNDETIPTAADCPPSNAGCVGLGGPQIRVASSNFRAGNTVNAPQNRDLKRYQFTDNLNWVKGAHRFRFGGEYEHNYGKGGWAFLDPALVVVHNPTTVLGVNQLVAASVNGLPLPAPVKAQIIAGLTIPVPSVFLTGGTPTLADILNLPVVAGNSGGTTIPLVGIGDPSQPPPFNTDIARQSNRARFYGQDSWLARPGLTISFGASYQYETNLQNHDLAKPALLLPLLGTTAKPGKDKNNIAPSVGFSWDLGNKGKTVIRGGAGIYYDTVLFVTRLRERSAIGPIGNGRSQIAGTFFQNTISFPQIPGLPSPLNLINVPLGAPIFFGLFPTKLTGANFLAIRNAQVPVIENTLKSLGSSGLTGIDFFKTGTDILDPNLEVPFSEQISLGVQRQLTSNMSVSVDFVYRRLMHTLQQYDAEFFSRPAATGGPIIRPCTTAEAFNPAVACANGPVGVIKSIGRDDYRALLVKLDKRFANRVQFTASYALSRYKGFPFVDFNNLFGHYTYTDADVKHRFTFSGVVDLPYGFQTSLIAVYQSKPPMSARLPDTVDINGDGVGGDPLPGVELNSLNRGIDRDTFLLKLGQFNATQPASSQLIIPANFRFGDDFQSEDIRITKTFKFRERWQAQGFFEVFNIFNISNLTGYGQTLGSGFGVPTGRAGQNFGTGGPRAIQLGGRFQF